MCGFLPKNSSTAFWSAGMRVCPPTSTTSLISAFLNGDASIARFVIAIARSMNSCVSSSSFPRVSLMSRCCGPASVEVMNGIFTSVSSAVESSILAFSAASSSRCRASASVRTSTPLSRLNSSASQSMIFWSMSLPPRCASPSVERTSITSSPTSSTDISKVPPPKSNTTIFSFFFLLNPYASAAAVGSLMIRFTSRPAILPASRVAARWASLKYAGTVMTASVIVSPRRASASLLSFCKIIADISSGRYQVSPIFTSIPPLADLRISKGTAERSLPTISSSKLWPMKRLI